MPLCRKDTSWFDAIVRGDFAFVQANIEKYKRQYDSRTSPDTVHRGWCGIHYAVALRQKQIFELLFPLEYDLLTDQPAGLFCPGLDRKVNIEAGSSIIHIIIAVNAVEFMQYIFSRWGREPEFGDLAGCKNDLGQSCLLLCPMFNTDAAMMWATNEKAIRNEVRLCSNVEQNFIMIISMLGRVRYAELIKDLCTTQSMLKIEGRIDKLKDVLKEQFVQRDSGGKNWKELAEMPLDPVNFKIGNTDKAATLAMLQEILDQAK